MTSRTTGLHDVQQYIYDCIVDLRGNLPAPTMWTIAGNIAFLVKFKYGPDINPAKLSVPIIDIRRPSRPNGQRAVVLVHIGAGKFTVIVQAEVSGQQHGKTLIVSLAEEVDAAIKDILDAEGSQNCHPSCQPS